MRRFIAVIEFESILQWAKLYHHIFCVVQSVVPHCHNRTNSQPFKNKSTTNYWLNKSKALIDTATRNIASVRKIKIKIKWNKIADADENRNLRIKSWAVNCSLGVESVHINIFLFGKLSPFSGDFQSVLQMKNMGGVPLVKAHRFEICCRSAWDPPAAKILCVTTETRKEIQEKKKKKNRK